MGGMARAASWLYNNNNTRFIYRHIHGSWRFTVKDVIKNKIYIKNLHQ